MTVATTSVHYERSAADPLLVEQLTEPDQITAAIALGAMQVLANGYAASRGISAVVPRWAIYDHFVPLDAEKKLQSQAIIEQQNLMQSDVAAGNSYWISRELEDDGRMTGLAKTNPSHATKVQKTLKAIGRHSPNVFVAELVEVAHAKGAEPALLHAVVSHGGYNLTRNVEIDVYDANTSQRILVTRRLGMEPVARGDSYSIMGKQLKSTRYESRTANLSQVQKYLEEYAGWLKTGQLVEA